jgi:hypothetical protein
MVEEKQDAEGARDACVSMEVESAAWAIASQGMAGDVRRLAIPA